MVMLTALRNFILDVPTRLSRLGSPLRLLVAAAIVVVAILILLWLFNQIFFYILARSYVDEVTRVLGINRYLANAIVWVAFALIVIFARYALSFSKSKRRVGILGVLALLIGQSVVLWYFTRDKPFDRDGNANKCYIITRESIEYGDSPGIDPKTGLECRPVTKEMVERLQKYQDGNRPKLVVAQNPVFFDPRTGNPIVVHALGSRRCQIRTARLETFWTDAPDALPVGAQDQMWWGLWCHRDSEAEIEDVCARS